MSNKTAEAKISTEVKIEKTIELLNEIIKDNKYFYTDYLLVIIEMLKKYNPDEYFEDNFTESILLKVKNIIINIEKPIEDEEEKYIEIPIYSEEKNKEGEYDIIGYKKEYI